MNAMRALLRLFHWTPRWAWGLGVILLGLSLPTLVWAAPTLLGGCSPLDPRIATDQVYYQIMRGATDWFVSLDLLFVGSAWLTNMLREIIISILSTALFGGDGVVGIVPALMPLYYLMAMVAAGLLALFTAASYLTKYPVSSMGRIIGAVVLGAYLAISGGDVMKFYDRIRTGMGELLYNAAYTTMSEGLAGVIPGGSGTVDVGLCSSLSANGLAGSPNQSSAPCNGYGLTLSFLFFTDRNQVFAMRAPDEFLARYYVVRGINYAQPPNSVTSICGTPEAVQLQDQMVQGVLRAIFALPMAIVALLEQAIWFILTLGVLTLFISLAIALVFAALTPFGNQLSDIVQQLVKVLTTTATTGFYMGMVMALLFVTTSNAVFFLGASMLALAMCAGVLVQVFSTTMQALNAAGNGVVQSGWNAVERTAGIMLFNPARSMQGAFDKSKRDQARGANKRKGGAEDPNPNDQTASTSNGVWGNIPRMKLPDEADKEEQRRDPNAAPGAQRGQPPAANPTGATAPAGAPTTPLDNGASPTAATKSNGSTKPTKKAKRPAKQPGGNGTAPTGGGSPAGAAPATARTQTGSLPAWGDLPGEEEEDEQLPTAAGNGATAAPEADSDAEKPQLDSEDEVAPVGAAAPAVASVAATPSQPGAPAVAPATPAQPAAPAAAPTANFDPAKRQPIAPVVAAPDTTASAFGSPTAPPKPDWRVAAAKAYELSGEYGSDPAEKWDVAFGGAGLDGYGGQVRDLTRASQNAGIPQAVFTSVLSAAATGDEKTARELIYPAYFADEGQVMAYYRRAQRVAKWAEKRAAKSGG
jgi:hypothetical protein